MPRKRTHEEFVELLKSVNENIIVIGQYLGNLKKIKVKCKICGHEWETTPAILLGKHGCPVCAGNKKRTHEQFVKEVYENNPYVEIIGTYLNVDTPILVKCKICGEEYMSMPQRLLNGKIHKKCSTKIKPRKTVIYKTHEEYAKEVWAKGKTVEFLTEYVNQQTKIHVRCTKCGRDWWADPKTLLRDNGTGCVVCSMEIAKYKMRMTHEEFIQRVAEINPHVEILSNYTREVDEIRVRCKICGHEHTLKAGKLLSRHYNCQLCSDSTSFPNRFMTALLDENKIEFIPEKTFDWSENKRYDFYIPSSSTIIEVHGDQHYRTANKGSNWGYNHEDIQENDRYKRELALKNGVKHYIEIDARKSFGEYIFDSVTNSEIEYLTKDVLLTDVLKNCLFNSKVAELVNLYNNGVTKNILLTEELNVSKNTVASYIKLAKEANLIA